jgi:hypothetical protein
MNMFKPVRHAIQHVLKDSPIGGEWAIVVVSIWGNIELMYSTGMSTGEAHGLLTIDDRCKAKPDSLQELAAPISDRIGELNLDNLDGVAEFIDELKEIAYYRIIRLSRDTISTRSKFLFDEDDANKLHADVLKCISNSHTSRDYIKI